MSLSFATLATLAGVHLAIAMTPGPNTLIVLANAARDRRLGFAAAAGVWPVGLFWASAGMLGLGALFQAFPQAETALSLACGGYLLWLGLKAVRASAKVAQAGGDSAAAAATPARAFIDGVATNLTNPKTIAYFSSVFAATGALEANAETRLAAIVMMPTIGFLWYVVLTLCVSSGPVARALEAGRVWVDRTTGGLMILFGVKLLAQR